MKFDKNYRVVSDKVDITKLREAILDVDDDEWNENQFRQNLFYVAREVKTLLLKMNGYNTCGGQSPDDCEVNESWSKWENLVQPIIDQVIKYYPGYERGFINKCMMPNMKPGTKIPEHWDSMESFRVSHRIHVPIITNDEVYFMVNGERVIMEVGKAYEINNRELHSVENKGNTDRVHLLFDLYIPQDDHD